MSKAQNIINTINEFGQRKTAIERDLQLSDIGKQTKLKQLANERDLYRGQVKRDLMSEWQDVRLRYKSIEGKRAELHEQAARQWDYQRLGYYALAIERSISQASEVQHVAQAYNGARQSGDKHLLRAWGEVGAARVSQRFAGKPELGSLTRQMAGDLADILDTPELAENRQAEAEIAEQAYHLREATVQAAEFFEGRGSQAMGGGEFYGLMDGIQISERVDVATLNMQASLSIK